MNDADGNSDETTQAFWKRVLRETVQSFALAFIVAFVLAFMGASWEQILVVMGVIAGWNKFVPDDLFK